MASDDPVRASQIAEQDQDLAELDTQLDALRGERVSDDESYPHARPPRRKDGCPACGADVTPTKSKEVWPQHPTAGTRGAERCGLSGLGISNQTDSFFRTFYDRENPDDFPMTGHQITTQLEDFGNAIGFVNRAAVASGHTQGPGTPIAEIVCRIVKDDYPRLLNELDRLARWRGWID